MIPFINLIFKKGEIFMVKTLKVLQTTEVDTKRKAPSNECLIFPRSAKGDLVLVSEAQRVAFLRRVLSLDYLLNGYNEMVINKITSDWHLENKMSDSDSSHEYGLEEDGTVSLTYHRPPCGPDFIPFEDELVAKYQVGVINKYDTLEVVFIPKDLVKGKRLPTKDLKHFFSKK